MDLTPRVRSLKDKISASLFSKRIDSEVALRKELVSLLERYYGTTHLTTQTELVELASSIKIVSLSDEQRESAFKARERYRAGITFQEEQNPKKAMEYFNDAWTINRELLGDNDIATIGCVERIANTHFQLHQFDGAVDRQRIVIEESRKLYSDPHPTIALGIGTLALYELARGNVETAAAQIDEALAMDDKLDFSEDIDHARRLIVKAGILNRTERYAEALKAAKLSTSIVATIEPVEVGVLVGSQMEAAKAYHGLGEHLSCVTIFSRMTKYFQNNRDELPHGKEMIVWLKTYRASLIALRKIEFSKFLNERIAEEERKSLIE